MNRIGDSLLLLLNKVRPYTTTAAILYIVKLEIYHLIVPEKSRDIIIIEYVWGMLEKAVSTEHMFTGNSGAEGLVYEIMVQHPLRCDNQDSFINTKMIGPSAEVQKKHSLL